MTLFHKIDVFQQYVSQAQLQNPFSQTNETVRINKKYAAQGERSTERTRKTISELSVMIKENKKNPQRKKPLAKLCQWLNAQNEVCHTDCDFAGLHRRMSQRKNKFNYLLSVVTSTT